MSTTKFLMTKDIAGYNGFGVIPSTEIYGAALAQGVDQVLAVCPTDYSNYIAIYSYTPGSQVFIDDTGATAAVFSGTAGQVTSELNPQARQVTGGTSISAITPDTSGAYVQVSFYVVAPYVN